MTRQLGPAVSEAGVARAETTPTPTDYSRRYLRISCPHGLRREMYGTTGGSILSRQQFFQQIERLPGVIRPAGDSSGEVLSLEISPGGYYEALVHDVRALIDQTVGPELSNTFDVSISDRMFPRQPGEDDDKGERAFQQALEGREAVREAR